jgi:hypothetical protein
MRSLARVVLTAVVVTAGPVLSACSSSSLDSLDPSEWFDTKKKLSGERKAVFPEGVPGVSSGVPPELVKGYREPEGGVSDPAKAAAEAAAEKPAKPKKPAPQRTASKPKPNAPDSKTATPQRPAQAATAPWPAQQQSAQPASAPWPSQQPPPQAPPPQAAWPGSR